MTPNDLTTALAELADMLADVTDYNHSWTAITHKARDLASRLRAGRASADTKETLTHDGLEQWVRQQVNTPTPPPVGALDEDVEELRRYMQGPMRAHKALDRLAARLVQVEQERDEWREQLDMAERALLRERERFENSQRELAATKRKLAEVREAPAGARDEDVEAVREAARQLRARAFAYGAANANDKLRSRQVEEYAQLTDKADRDLGAALDRLAALEETR